MLRQNLLFVYFNNWFHERQIGRLFNEAKKRYNEQQEQIPKWELIYVYNWDGEIGQNKASRKNAFLYKLLLPAQRSTNKTPNGYIERGIVAKDKE